MVCVVFICNFFLKPENKIKNYEHIVVKIVKQDRNICVKENNSFVLLTACRWSCVKCDHVTGN